MNFQDQFYYQITGSLSNKKEIVKEKEAILVYVVSEKCVEFIVYNYRWLREDELGNKHVLYLTNTDGSPRIQKKVRYHETLGLQVWRDTEDDSIVFSQSDELVAANSEILIQCWNIGVKELANRKSILENKNADPDLLLESAMKSAREKIVEKWETTEFPGGGFLVLPTPREYAKHLQTYYKDKIVKLEEEVTALRDQLKETTERNMVESKNDEKNSEEFGQFVY